ncbi:3-hydroxyacyl-CoA dehydrogenase family protein [Halocatena marina]|uniref:3-hydroxyacyl-CoA dehydrogenase family protein n=1 Tax=Halocatena marina TaxID=2934937 RepID=A0ABD5YQ78_9EURY|nr:3-hydroxyacyl-CoA dehydrogenase family protein [Halocatena marina]
MTVVDHVAIIGAGIMGSGIGQNLLQNGYQVTIRDIEQDVLDDARERIEFGNYGLNRAVEGGYLTEDEKADALDRLELTTDIEAAVNGTDMVIEAVPEDLALKGRVFNELSEVTNDDIPLYTNSSGFSVASVSNAVEDPSRVAGAHFFNPAQIMDLVEIVKAEATDQSVIDLMTDVVEDIGKTPVMVEDAPERYGFIVNRIWGAMVEEARQVVREGIASEDDVNVAMRKGRNLPVGPLEGASIGEEWD